MLLVLLLPLLFLLLSEGGRLPGPAGARPLHPPALQPHDGDSGGLRALVITHTDFTNLYYLKERVYSLVNPAVQPHDGDAGRPLATRRGKRNKENANTIKQCSRDKLRRLDAARRPGGQAARRPGGQAARRSA